MVETELEPDEYRCEICGGIFKKGWSDEDAIAEQKRNFNEAPAEDDAILCDDCYKQFISKIFN